MPLGSYSPALHSFATMVAVSGSAIGTLIGHAGSRPKKSVSYSSALIRLPEWLSRDPGGIRANSDKSARLGRLQLKAIKSKSK
ncbi:exported hypothetical protein [Verrucomicrobia bacterium]|nr:exported hypothetical protein [Verrucomicrobiota bacterium]